MPRINNLHNGINLAQGFPDFDPPAELIEAAVRALNDGYHQYAITWGSPRLRQVVAEKFAWYNGVEVDPERHITVTCGATEAMMATLLAVVDPGDEVVIFEPFYENYGPDALLSGAVPRYVQLNLRDPEFAFDPAELRAAFSPKTKAIILNTPHNPTGKVFTRGELELIADLCRTFDALAVTDEVYEHILYVGIGHPSIAAPPGMAERTVTTKSLSQTYSGPGRAHDLVIGGAVPRLKEGWVPAFRFPPAYYRGLAAMYEEKRNLMLRILGKAGFRAFTPRGAYYIMTDFGGLSGDDDVTFAHRLVTQVGVATVPGSSFYHAPALGRPYVRFAFPQRAETLTRVAERLHRVREVVGG